MKNKLHLMLGAVAALFVARLREQFATANAESTAGAHGGVITKLSDAAFTNRHLLVKAGTDADHVNICGASDVPWGLTDDAPAAAEDPVDVIQLGISRQTRRMTCITAIAKDTDVYAAANGTVVALPGIAGTYYLVGRTVEVAVIFATNLYTVQVQPRRPTKTLVIATATGTAATDIAALFTALQSGPALIKSL